MTNKDDVSANAAATAGAGTAVLNRLPDSQVFSRDAEDYTQEAIEDTIARLQKIVARQRKSRNDEAEISELTAKLKKANAVAAKAKAKKSKPTTNLMEQPI